MDKKLPKGWEYITLGELFLIERGGSPRPIENYITDSVDGINWIKIGDTKGITKYIYKTKEKIKPEGLYKSRMVYEDDFILSNSMSFGRPYIMKTKGCIHDGWLVIRPNKDIVDLNFLYYMLSSSFVYQQFSSLAKGSTVKNLNIVAVQQVYIYLPPLPEQQRIVAKLEALFGQLDRIKTSMERIPQLLKDFRKKVLTQAVTGKLTEEWRKGKELEEWEKTYFKELVIDSANGLSKRKGDSGTFVNVLRLADFKNAIRNIGGERKIQLTTKELDNYKLEQNDLLVIRVNGSVTIAGLFIVYSAIGEPEAYCDHFIRYRIIENKVLPIFLSYITNNGDGRSYLQNSLSTSAGQNTINQKSIGEMPLDLPPIEEQQEIVHRVESLFAKADQIEASYQKLKTKIAELPQALLAKAFRGELVEQLRTDGDAKDLLEQIRQAKASLEKGGKSKKLKAEEEVRMVAEDGARYGKK